MGRSHSWSLPIFGSCDLACGTKWHTLLSCRAFQPFTQRLQTKKESRHSMLLQRLKKNGAEGETRTPMKEPSLDPEPSVSTNSTTSAWKGGIPKTFRAGKRKNALSEEISAKTTLPSVFPPDFGSAPPRNWRCHPLSHGEDAGRADCPPQE